MTTKLQFWPLKHELLNEQPIENRWQASFHGLFWLINPSIQNVKCLLSKLCFHSRTWTSCWNISFLNAFNMIFCLKIVWNMTWWSIRSQFAIPMSLVNSVIIGVLHSIHDPMRARQSTRSITYHQGTRSAGDYLMAKISRAHQDCHKPKLHGSYLCLGPHAIAF